MPRHGLGAEAVDGQVKRRGSPPPPPPHVELGVPGTICASNCWGHPLSAVPSQSLSAPSHTSARRIPHAPQWFGSRARFTAQPLLEVLSPSPKPVAHVASQRLSMARGAGLRGRRVPTLVVDLTDAVEIATGAAYTCARRATGQIVCWGGNDRGQLGDGTMTQRTTPTPVVGITDAVEIAAGSSHACAQRTTGDVLCWGNNTFGRLGDGTTTTRATPTPVVGLR